MIVRWTANAIGHLEGIHDYIARNSPAYALHVVDRITRRSEQIAAFPRSNRVVPEYDTDEVREVFEKPYRIIYRVLPDRVEILAIIHGARRLPPIP